MSDLDDEEDDKFRLLEQQEMLRQLQAAKDMQEQLAQQNRMVKQLQQQRQQQPPQKPPQKPPQTDPQVALQRPAKEVRPVVKNPFSDDPESSENEEEAQEPAKDLEQVPVQGPSVDTEEADRLKEQEEVRMLMGYLAKKKQHKEEKERRHKEKKQRHKEQKEREKLSVSPESTAEASTVESAAGVSPEGKPGSAVKQISPPAVLLETVNLRDDARAEAEPDQVAPLVLEDGAATPPRTPESPDSPELMGGLKGKALYGSQSSVRKSLVHQLKHKPLSSPGQHSPEDQSPSMLLPGMNGSPTDSPANANGAPAGDKFLPHLRNDAKEAKQIRSGTANDESVLGLDTGALAGSARKEQAQKGHSPNSAATSGRSTGSLEGATEHVCR
eukprot:CAMPEP_0184328330 /NCGR_PEP_ID=MMETSP1049-20130417/143565_1 /TAXON_ID=77928 /ORGANISM="Proteomonas sulcata, Strain CCMP704" /LENGTH=384 /DNA_ID=CAMNT_0026650635 /DNA_START=224 /DNA_END=1378 /DNA_ORIENTATION=+